MRSAVFLGLGSNLGDRQANLDAALARLTECGTLESRSGVYETEPVGLTDQPAFLNLACRLDTALSSHELLTACKSIEAVFGRRSTVRNGPRVIDIDILLYDSLVLSDSGLLIPHPRLTERAFVLVPLAEIAPDTIEPRTGKTISQLLDQCPDHHWVRPLSGGPHVQTVR